MKKNIITPVFIFLAVILTVTLTVTLSVTLTVTAAWAEGDEEVEHPEIVLMDKEGNEITGPGTAISGRTTCGECHDADEINRHTKHVNQKVKVECMDCHFKDGKTIGDYTQAHMMIRRPTSQNCVSCHGIAHTGSEPLSIPGDYTHNLEYTPGKKNYGMTQRTGAVISHQRISASALNLRDKSNRNAAWDVHARLQMDCLTCHNKREGQKAFNHDINTAACTSCHDALAGHNNLTYKEKHLEVLSCQSCHVSVIYGPAFRTVDRTVVDTAGSARVELRGVDESRSHGTSLNTKYYKGFLPFLFPSKENGGAKYRISPFNLVTRWYWKSRKTDETVPLEVVKQAYYAPGSSRYAGDILKVFDKNRDNRIDAGELVLDSEEKTALIAKKLAALGVEEPEIAGTVEAFKIKHGMVSASRMKWDCSVCHAGESKMGRDILLTAASPGGPKGIGPEFSKDLQPQIQGDITVAPGGEVLLKQTASVTGHYVFGHSRTQWLRQLGVWIFFLGIFFIVVHMGVRFVGRSKHSAAEQTTAPRYLYPFFDRFWHWLMAAIFTLTVLTGLEIHFTGSFKLFGLASAVSIHDVLTPILVGNVVLALLYHFTGGQRLKAFFGFNGKIVREALTRKGRRGEQNPNRFQRLTYIVLLNILLPFQVITGVLMWAAGFRDFAPIHNFGSWLFLTFLIIHLYLTTTGHGIFSRMRAMITGYDEEVVKTGEKPDDDRMNLADMRILDAVGTMIGRPGNN